MSKNDGTVFAQRQQSDNDIIQLKENITKRLKILYQDILEEKTLGSQIKINILPTPYKKIAISSVEELNKLSAKLVCSETLLEVKSIDGELEILEEKIHYDLNGAYIATTEMLEKIRNNIKLDDLKNKIKTIIQKKIKDKCNQEKHYVNNIKFPDDFKQRLRKAVELKQQEIKHSHEFNLFEKELIFMANCLIQGDTELLAHDDYFKSNPHLLKKHYPENHVLSENAFRIFVKVNIRKNLKLMNYKEDRPLIFDKIISYIQTLALETKHPITNKIHISQMNCRIKTLKQERELIQKNTAKEVLQKLYKGQSILDKIKNIIINLVMGNNKLIPVFINRVFYKKTKNTYK